MALRHHLACRTALGELAVYTLRCCGVRCGVSAPWESRLLGCTTQSNKSFLLPNHVMAMVCQHRQRHRYWREAGQCYIHTVHYAKSNRARGLSTPNPEAVRTIQQFLSTIPGARVVAGRHILPPGGVLPDSLVGSGTVWRLRSGGSPTTDEHPLPIPHDYGRLVG